MRRFIRQRLRPALLLLAIVPVLVIPVIDRGEEAAGRVLVPESWRMEHPGAHTITIDLVVDEEWVASFGPQAESVAREIVESASEMLAPGDVTLRTSSYAVWTSPADATSIGQMYESLAVRPAQNADIVVGLSDQLAGMDGGMAGGDGRHVLIKHHHYRNDHDVLVLAHEIGHVLGLTHHHCPHLFCIMSSHAYDSRRHFCPEHLRLLKANGGLFQYLASPGINGG